MNFNYLNYISKNETIVLTGQTPKATYILTDKKCIAVYTFRVDIYPLNHITSIRINSDDANFYTHGTEIEDRIFSVKFIDTFTHQLVEEIVKRVGL